ncbi:MAG TPA: alanine/glycine:cation symporter family protein [Haloplasmataceae bacterium]
MKYFIEVIIWGYPLMLVLIITSIYFGIRTRFAQIRYLKLMPKLLFEKNNDQGKISAFQSIALILANHIGTGNIVGVAMAIMYGGPGAVFWMWITALLCSSLSVVENTLGQMYKTEVNGEYRGGPAYYIFKGIGSKTWAYVMALIFLICLGLLMPTIQAAVIATTFYKTFHISKVIIGLFVTITLGVIIYGNSRKIVHTAEVLVPFMAISYLILAFIIIVFNISKLDDVLILIINSALNKKSLYGGIIGSAISIGVRRGVFSHEAGIGSSPNISASTDVNHPFKQGLMSSFCVFIDTIVICSATAFMILITDCFNVIDGNKVLYIGLLGQDYNSFVSEAINTVIPNWGPFFVSLAIFLFAYTSLFSSFYNAQSNLIFLFSHKKSFNKANFIYKTIFLVMIFLSSIFNMEFVWGVTDLGVGIAAFMNIIVIIILSDKFLEVQRDFAIKYKKKDNTRYYNKTLECWKK